MVCDGVVCGGGWPHAGLRGLGLTGQVVPGLLTHQLTLQKGHGKLGPSPPSRNVFAQELMPNTG